MRYRPLALLLPWLALAGCGTPQKRAEFTNGYPAYDCPETLEGQVMLQAEVRPIQIDGTLLQQPSIDTTGALARRLLIAVTPSGLRPRDRIIWSNLSITTFGGTLLGWQQFDTAISETGDVERTTVVSSPGQLKITHIAIGHHDLSGHQSIDLLVMPGGVAVDDTVVHFPALWADGGAPVAPNMATPQLMALRHPPALDVVEATLELSFVVRLADSGEEWVCNSQTRTLLVDQESLRQPLWDVGPAFNNSVRKERLALFDPAVGAVRLVFADPAKAHLFLTWVRATGATQIGDYSLTLIQPATGRGTRPFGPISDDVMATLRPVTPADRDMLNVGPAGDP